MKGKTVFISGASSGIGRQLALVLSANGAAVILVARRQERLIALQQEITSKGGTAKIYVCDLEEEKARKTLIDEIIKTEKVDILVNNAGFGWYGYYADMPVNLIHSLVSVNIDAMLDLTRALLPGMRERGYGHIINIGSIAGGFPNQGIAMYSASKAFMDAFSTALFREMRGSGVCVSVLRLGPVKTEFFDRAKTLENGRKVPAERFSIPVERAVQGVLRLLKTRKRYLYVPKILGITRLVELFFGGVIDLLGPLLLRRRTE